MTTLSDETKRIFENLPADKASDETDIGLRAYITRLAEENLADYDPDWSGSQKPSSSRKPPSAATMSRATLGFSVITSALLTKPPQNREGGPL